MPKNSPRLLPSDRSTILLFVQLDETTLMSCTAEQMSDFKILRFLHQRGSATLSELIDEFTGTKQNLYGRLSRLLRGGYVQSIYSRSAKNGLKMHYRYSLNPETLIHTWNLISENEKALTR